MSAAPRAGTSTRLAALTAGQLIVRLFGYELLLLERSSPAALPGALPGRTATDDAVARLIVLAGTVVVALARPEAAGRP